jgi:hypothetical protein
MVCIENPGQEDLLHLTHPTDLHLIQAHLQSLERSHQSAASIHTVLSQRLESSMQAMHTPPDTSSALAFPGPMVDDSWTIFDQEIMSLANPPWLFQDPSPFPRTQKPSTQTVPDIQAGLPYDSGLLTHSAQQFSASNQWANAEQLHGALPSTLNRIFGNENSNHGNRLI